MIYHIEETNTIPSITIFSNGLNPVGEAHSIEELANIIHTPADLLETFRGNMIQYTDVNEYTKISWPKDIIANHAGNCVDISIFAHKFFSLNNIEHAIGFTMFVDEIYGTSKQIGHAFPIFKENNKYHILNYFYSGVGDINGYFLSFEEAADKAGRYFDILYKSEYSMNVDPNNNIPRTAISTALIGNKYDLRFIDDNYDKDILQTKLLDKSYKITELKNLVQNIRKERYNKAVGMGAPIGVPIQFVCPTKNIKIIKNFLHRFDDVMKWI